MSPSISATETSDLFSFSGDDCLYRDQNGHRVLADVERPGRFQILAASHSSALFLDDEPSQMFEGAYDHSLMVTDPEPSCSIVAAATGRCNPALRQIETGQTFEQSGWIVSADEVFEIDSDHRPRQPPVPGFPYPFFCNASGRNLQIVAAAQTAILVDRFSVDEPDTLKARGWRVQNASVVSRLESAFPDGTSHDGPVISHLNAASWRLTVPAGCSGVLIRKLYDVFHGRQRARVLLDGKFQGWWWEPVQNRKERWRWASFGIKFNPTRAAGEHVITIDPPAGAPLWSVGQVEVWGLLDPR